MAGFMLRLLSNFYPRNGKLDQCTNNESVRLETPFSVVLFGLEIGSAGDFRSVHALRRIQLSTHEDIFLRHCPGRCRG